MNWQFKLFKVNSIYISEFIFNFLISSFSKKIKVCLKTRPQNGGIIDVEELTKHLRELRGKNSQAISVYVHIHIQLSFSYYFF